MGDESLAGHSFELSVPPSPESVAVCRLFTGAVARHFSINEDVIGDLKVAVSEAVTNSISSQKQAGSSATPVRLRIVCEDGSCSVEVSDPAGGFRTPLGSPETGTPPAGLYEGSLGLTLIRSLFPDAQISAADPAGTLVRFTARL